MSDTEPLPTRCGFVALLGAPNAGKSTLLNALVGAKVSIVSRKVQTTRSTVRGIAIRGAAQVVFVDTPGVFSPRRRLDRAMVAAAWGGAADADLVALIVDARRGADGEMLRVLDGLGQVRAPRVLVLNKADALADKSKLLPLAADLAARGNFEQTFMISALRGTGVSDLMDAMAERMPPSPWLYPEDQISDAPLRSLAAEIVREALFERLHDELPYQSHVETDSWEVRPDGSARVEATIFVERDSQRAIVLGEGGRAIKAIGTAARKEIEEAAESRIHLFLHVKVRENWADDPARYRGLGLDFPKD